MSSIPRDRWLAGLRFFGFLILIRLVLIPILFSVCAPLLRSSETYGTGIAEGLLLACVLLATFIMAKIGRRPFLSFGLGDQFFTRHFFSGALFGFLALTFQLLALESTHHLHLRFSNLRSSVLLEAALWNVLLFLIVATFEETAFRGYALYTLSDGIGFWPGAIAMSLLFALAHRGNPGEARLGLVAVFVFGTVLAFSLWRTGSLLWAIGFHFMWDYSETFIYGVPDSGYVAPEHLLSSRFTGPAWITGGSVGPEGSIFIFVVLAIVALGIHLLYPARRRQI